jgi:hypothetical protein
LLIAATRQQVPAYSGLNSLGLGVAGAGLAPAAGETVPEVTFFALLVDDGNPKLVMIRDPHEKQPDFPYWKLLGHVGQAHKVLCTLLSCLPCPWPQVRPSHSAPFLPDSLHWQITMAHLENLKFWRGTKAQAEISYYDCKDAYNKVHQAT